MKLDEILDKYLNTLKLKGCSKYTLKAYKLDLLDYLSHLEIEKEEKKIDYLLEATSIDFKTYKSYLGASSPATIKRKFTALKTFLSWCLKVGLRKNPIPELPKLPTSQPLSPRWLSRNDLNALLRIVEKEKSLRDKTIVHLLLNTGLRVGELVSLKWEDIEIGRYNGTLKVCSGKGQKVRFIPLNTTARKVLNAYFETFKEKKEYLFYGKRKNKLNEDAVLRLFYSLAKKAEIKVTPHDLRHTFCKNLLDKNISLDKIATLAGHSSLAVTQKYTTPSLQDLNKAVIQLDD